MSQCDTTQINNLTNQLHQTQKQLKTSKEQIKHSGQTHKFNSFISQASDAIMCNSDCQNKREAEKLKQTYLDSQSNLVFAPGKFEVAEKNYITFTEGTPAYDEVIDNRLNEEAEKITDVFIENFNNSSQNISSQIETYNSLILNYKNVLELYLKYKVENIELAKQLKDETNDILTNDRKTYYEDQQIDSLKYFYFYFLLSVYVVCVICYLIFSFVYPSQTKFIIRFGIFVCLVLLPFFSSMILSTIIELLHVAYNLLPKNVYNEKTF
jgi:hypothetical protein